MLSPQDGFTLWETYPIGFTSLDMYIQAVKTLAQKNLYGRADPERGFCLRNTSNLIMLKG